MRGSTFLLSIFKQIFSTFEPLRDKNLRTYILGQALSLIGTWMQMTAQSWLVWELTHSSAALGFMGVLSFGPFLLLGPWTGVIADRMDRRKLLIATQVFAMILAFILALLVQTHVVQFWHVIVLGALLGISGALDSTAQQSFLGDLSGVAQIRKAVLINNIVFQVSRMVGPFLAGILIHVVGMASAFWINGISFVAVIYSLIVVRAQQIQTSEKGSGTMKDFSQSLRLIKNDPRLQYLMAFTLIMTFFGLSNMQIMAAFVSTQLQGDSKLLGLIMGASGAGALFGSLCIVPLTHRVEKIGKVFFLGGVWGGFWFFIFSQMQNPYLAMAAIFLGSCTFPVVLTNVAGLIQMLAAPDMRARMVSTWFMFSFGVQPFASLFIGFYANWVGPDKAIGFNSLMIILFVITLYISQAPLRKWRLVLSEPLVSL